MDAFVPALAAGTLIPLALGAWGRARAPTGALGCLVLGAGTASLAVGVFAQGLFLPLGVLALVAATGIGIVALARSIRTRDPWSALLGLVAALALPWLVLLMRLAFGSWPWEPGGTQI